MAINVFALSALGAFVPSIGFALMAIVLPYLKSGKVHIGNTTLETSISLWKSCEDDGNGEYCIDALDRVEWSESDRHSLRAARAMVLLGFFTTIAMLVHLILFLRFMKERKVIGILGCVLAAAAGTMFMITMALFVGKLQREDYFLEAPGFAFNILAWGTCWTGSVQMFLAVMRNAGEVGDSSRLV